MVQHPLFWLVSGTLAAATIVAALRGRRTVAALIDDAADEIRPVLLGRPTSIEPLRTARAVAPKVG